MGIEYTAEEAIKRVTEIKPGVDTLIARKIGGEYGCVVLGGFFSGEGR